MIDASAGARAADKLVRSGAFGLVVLDLAGPAVGGAAQRVDRLVERAGWAGADVRLQHGPILSAVAGQLRALRAASSSR